MTWTLSAFADEADPSCDGQIKALARGGLSHIDLRSVDGYNITELPQAQAREVKTKLDDAGVTVHMYGSPIGKIDLADDVKIDIAKLNHLANMRDVFGCTRVRIFSYYNAKAKKPKDQWRTEAVDRLRTLADEAGKLGLVLYHENESDIFGDHSDDVLVLAELRDGDRFKLIYDFANYIRTGEDGWTTWQKFRDMTDCFHFKDQRKDGQHVPMGQGDTDSTRIVADAHAAGWSGFAVLEPHLTHSAAVLATHAHGTGDQSLKDMAPADSFHVAVEGAQKFLADIGAKWN